ncbi:FkbM family methyltransferase [Candidatus Pelagibacter sp. HIMB1593]|uniref:FkbM family methyltransferase n=1 Tax=Candidatus Pelagibacter sp. HIMB1593 TaxID=3413355 RepID=UPI003F870EFC
MINNLIQLLKFVWKHPSNKNSKISAIFRVLRWQIASRIMPGLIALPYYNKTYLYGKRGMTSASNAWYCGLYEYEEMNFLFDYLDADDLFVDIGANIGAYTILAASKNSKVIAVEPIPSSYEILKKNILLNDFSNTVDIYNVAISDKDESLKFSNNLDALNHVLVNGEKYSDIINIPAVKLDQILNGRIPKFIKIDVEGYESKVIDGAENIFSHNDLKCIIIELIGGGKNYSFDEDALHKKLLNYGFSTYTYIPSSKKLVSLQQKKNSNKNTIYLKKDFF